MNKTTTTTKPYPTKWVGYMDQTMPMHKTQLIKFIPKVLKKIIFQHFFN